MKQVDHIGPTRHRTWPSLVRILCLIAVLVGTASAQSGSAVGSGGAPAAPTAADEENRKICAAAMNADPKFAEKIVATINVNTAQEHRRAAAHIAKNEKHVILAYAAMWLAAAAFVFFLWRRQQTLKLEIALLKKDLEAAIAAEKPAVK